VLPARFSAPSKHCVLARPRRRPRLGARPASQSTCAVCGREPQRQLNVGTGQAGWVL